MRAPPQSAAQAQAPANTSSHQNTNSPASAHRSLRMPVWQPDRALPASGAAPAPTPLYAALRAMPLPAHRHSHLVEPAQSTARVPPLWLPLQTAAAAQLPEQPDPHLSRN